MDEQQLLTAVAVAIATKTVEGLTEGGRAAFAALDRLVRRKVGDVTEVGGKEDNEQQAITLRRALEAAVQDDGSLGPQLAELWHLMQTQQATTGDAVSNNVTGTVSGNVAQVRDVHGGITFGGPTTGNR